ncbi:hypothetical protein EYF80_066426 [Liparis tanakae]|uniref:Uncharacterized protein n=1 Tax=Liparis tanakae TaxID=230148 RepID=A0A4Z2E428_9TELE|nr:hypothetical protein EYF80_066426 [Liparis tanakae]
MRTETGLERRPTRFVRVQRCRSLFPFATESNGEAADGSAEGSVCDASGEHEWERSGRREEEEEEDEEERVSDASIKMAHRHWTLLRLADKPFYSGQRLRPR